MNKSIFLIITSLLISTIVFSQGIKSEIHLSPGLEITLEDPFRSYNNQNSKPSFGFQLSYQLIFNHVGFNIAMEFMTRNIDLKSDNQLEDFTSNTGKIRADRLMLYFVGRAGKEDHKVSLDLRFGIGKLLKNQDYYFNSPIDILHTIVPGLSFASGVKVNYNLSSIIAIYFDNKVSFIPYSYEIYRDHIWFQDRVTRSSYVLDLGFYFGINILLNSEN